MTSKANTSDEESENFASLTGRPTRRRVSAPRGRTGGLSWVSRQVSVTAPQCWAARTLGVRITLIVGAVALVVLGGSAWWARVLVGVGVTRAADTELARTAAAATAKLAAGVPEYSANPPSTRLDGVPTQIYVRVTDLLGHPLDHGPPLHLSAGLIRQLASGSSVSAPGHAGMVRWLGVTATTPDATPRLVLAATRVIGYTVLVHRGEAAVGLAGLIAAALVTLAAWVAVRMALRPVDRMRIAAMTLAPGQQLPLPVAQDELHDLALQINDLLTRRDAATDRLQRFTGDAAHELRSPIAAIRAQAEVAVLHPDPALVEETLRTVATEAARISNLVSALLWLAHADANTRPAPCPIDVTTQVRDAVARARAAASKDLTAPAAAGPDGEDACTRRAKGTTNTRPPAVPQPPVVTITATDPAIANASSAEVALVMDNLLGNAQRYARSRIWVSVLPAGQFVRVTVDDDGPGVPEDDRARVFDRFTRLEPGRGGITGGAGLGLALVKSLVTGRDGTVSMTSSPHGGARVACYWPRYLTAHVPAARSGLTTADTPRDLDSRHDLDSQQR